MTTLDIIFACITGVSLLVSLFLYFRKPQEDIETKQAVADNKVNSISELLSMQLKSEKETNDERFKEVNTRMFDALRLAENHTHTVEVKVDSLIGVVNTMDKDLSKEIMRLSTIIEERLPKCK